MTIFYKFEGKMYINITNGCPCDCVFCIRKNGDSITDNDSLWLEHEPDFDEIKSAFEKFDKSGITSGSPFVSLPNTRKSSAPYSASQYPLGALVVAKCILACGYFSQNASQSGCVSYSISRQ